MLMRYSCVNCKVRFSSTATALDHIDGFFPGNPLGESLAMDAYCSN
jgi:hypothetical protein